MTAKTTPPADDKLLSKGQPNKKPASVDKAIDQKIEAAKLGDEPEQGAHGPIADKQGEPLTAAEAKKEAKDAESLVNPPAKPLNPAIPTSAEDAYKEMEDGPQATAPFKATEQPIHGITEQIEDEQNGEVLYIASLEQAQALQEFDSGHKGKPAGKNAAFEFFKSRDGRTMRLIEVGGRHLAAQEVK